MQCDRRPHLLDVVFVHAVFLEKVARRICAIDFEAFRFTAVCLDETDVMEHRTDIKQLGIVLELFAFACQRAPQEHAARVVIKQIGFGVADEFGRCPRHCTVGNQS